MLLSGSSGREWNLGRELNVSLWGRCWFSLTCHGKWERFLKIERLQVSILPLRRVCSASVKKLMEHLALQTISNHVKDMRLIRSSHHGWRKIVLKQHDSLLWWDDWVSWKEGPDWTMSCQIFLAAMSCIGVHYCIDLIKDLRWTLLQFLLFLQNTQFRIYTYRGKKSSPSSPAVWSLQRISLAWLVLLNSYCVKWHVCVSPTETEYQNLFGNPCETEWVHFC